MAKLKKHRMSDEEFEREISNIMQSWKRKDSVKSISKLLSLKEVVPQRTSRFARINGFLGLTYYKQGDFDKSMTHYLKAQSYFEKYESKYSKMFIEILNSIGVLYNHQKRYAKALTVLYKSIKLSQKYGVSSSTANNNIAVVHLSSQDYLKALHHLDIGLQDLFKVKSLQKEIIVKSFLNKTGVLINLGQFNHAKTILYKLTKIVEVIAIQDLKDLYYIKWALFYFTTKDFVKAEMFCQKVLDSAKENGDNYPNIQACLLMSDIYSDLNQQEKAYFFLEKALNIAIKQKKSKVSNILFKFVEFHQKDNEFLKAQKVLKQILVIKEEERSNEENRESLEIQKSFESEQKDNLLKGKRKNNKNLKEKNIRLQNAVDKQHKLELHLKSLQLQLSPHFIFNTLQSIQGFIFQKDALATSDYLAKFASLMRSVLNASKKDRISLTEEVSMLTNYLALEKKRFGNKFEYFINTSRMENLDKTYLPSLLIQPFVENAIIHGFSAKANGKLHIIFRKFDNELFIHVIDNGIGRKASKLNKRKDRMGTSTALKIIQERQEYSQESKKFHFNYKILDRNPVGTHVVLWVLDLSV